MTRSRHRIGCLLVLALGVGTAVAPAQGEVPGGLSGRVVDRSGGPVPGATVTVTCAPPATPLGLRADESGRFQAPVALGADCAIAAALPGVEAASREVRRLADGERVEVELALDLDVVRERLEVTGTAARDSVEAREVRESFARDAGEALARLDGVHALRKGAIASDVVVRGFKGENLNVLIDGQRLYGACPNHMDPPAFHVDFAEIERIEVVKGPLDVTSSGSLGGTVNLVTRDPDAGATFMARLSAASAAFVAPATSASWAGPRWSVQGGASLRQGDSYVDGDGMKLTELLPASASAAYRASSRDRRAFDIATGWAGVERSLTAGSRLELSVARQEGEEQLYPYLQMDAEYDRATRTLLRYRAERPGSALRSLEASASYARVDHAMDDRNRVSSVGAPRLYSMRTVARSEVAGARVEATAKGGERSSLRFGLEGYDRRWDAATSMAGMSYRPQASLPDVGSTALGLYGELERTFGERLTLRAGARVDRAEVEADRALAATDLYFAYHGTRATSMARMLPSGNVALAWAPRPAWELTVSLGRTMRLPDGQELFFGLKRMGSDWVGNPQLRPAANLEADVAMRYRGERLSLQLASWRAAVNDFITVVERTRQNAVSGVTNSRARSFANVDARLVGGEASLQWTLGRHLLLVSGLSLVRGTQELAPARGVRDTDLPEMPPPTGRLALRYEPGRWYVEAEGRAAARQDRVDADLGESPTPAWETLDLRAGLELGRVRLVAGVDNLFDRAYVRSLSYQRDPFRVGVGVPEPGRTLLASVELRY